MGSHRVILKLSGEALASSSKGYDDIKIQEIGREVLASLEEENQIGIVIGGGNYWRGRSFSGIDRTKADQIGMLATVMNCIYVSEVFRSLGMQTAILSPFPIGTFTELYSKDAALSYMESGMVVFFAGGTGHPYFSTDTGIILRSLELDVDMVLMAKNIDGVYNKDPMIYPDAVRYDKLTFQEMLDNKLEVIDLTASALACQGHTEIGIFSLKEPGAITAAINGKIHGTIITP